MNPTIAYSVDGVVATIALNRPEVRNALNLEMCEALLAVSREISQSKEIRVVFVRGNGPVFCGGADLKERTGMSAEWIRARRMQAFAAYEALESLPMPCIALVHGAAIGSGVEIAAACALIVATRRSPSARPKRSAAPSAPPSACRASSASASPRT